MIQRIKDCVQLRNYLRSTIEDAGLTVEIDQSLEDSEYAAIKVDDYYKDLHYKTPPKSVDFLVSVDCACDKYALYILELKNVSSPHFLNIHEIQDKFTTTVEDFIKNRFKDIFLDEHYRYKSIKLYLVSDAYHICRKASSYEEYKSLQNRIGKLDSLKIDNQLSQRLYSIGHRICHIEYDIPPNPIIKALH